MRTRFRSHRAARPAPSAPSNPRNPHAPHAPHASVLPGDPSAVLAPIPLFAGLPVDELEQFAGTCEVTTAHPGQMIQAQDVPVRWWHLVIGGHAVVHRDNSAIDLLGRGDSWSEYSLLNGQRSPIAVVALSPLTLLTLDRRQFFALPERHPVLAGRLVARSATSADRLALPAYNALVHLERADLA